MGKYKTDKIDNNYIDKLKKEIIDAEPSPKTVVFNGDTYYLACVNSIKQVSGFLNEYLPKGETFPKFNNMIGCYYYPFVADPIDFLMSHVQQSQQKMPGSIKMPYVIYTTDKKDTALACNIMAVVDPDAKEKEKSPIMEFNIYKCKYFEEKKTTIELQYAFRIYGIHSQSEVMKEYEKLATQLAIEMYYTPIPELYKEL